MASAKPNHHGEYHPKSASIEAKMSCNDYLLIASDDVSSLVVPSRGIAMPDIDHCDDGFISNDNCAISHYAHNWKNDSPSDGFDISLTFSHFSQLKKSVDQYAEANNFKTRDHAKDYFSEDLFSNAYPDTPFVPKLPYRGRFVCSPLSARREKNPSVPSKFATYLIASAMLTPSKSSPISCTAIALVFHE